MQAFQFFEAVDWARGRHRGRLDLHEGALLGQVLTVREGLAEDFAPAVGNACLDLGTRDVREAIRVARLAGRREDLAKVVEALRRRR